MVTRTWVFQAIHLLCSAGVRSIRLRPVIQRTSSQMLWTTERIFPRCFTTRNDKHPSWAARRIEQLASVSSNGKLKMVTSRAEGCEMGLCPRVQSDGRNGMLKGVPRLPFLFRPQSRVILFFPLGVLWCPGPCSFCPMNGDRAAHEVTQQYYIGNVGVTNGGGRNLTRF